MSRSGESCVITGGAGGIGQAAAEVWLEAGGVVVCADVGDDSGRAVEREDPGRVEYDHWDTRDPAPL